MEKKFIVEKEIGKGSFSRVFKVRRTKDNKIYALKRIEIGKMKEKEKQNALNELRILASLNHPNIIKYRDCFLKNEVLAIITDLAEGGDLSILIKKFKSQNRRFQESLIKR
jgi:NIMA (never in mitosis gene a)-related kinase